MTAIEIFDDLCAVRRIGTRFFPIPDAVASLFDVRKDRARSLVFTLSGMFRPEYKIDIYVDFINSGQLNGHATIRESLGIVVLSRGSVQLPLDMFSRMLAHPKTLPDLGDAKNESVHTQHTEGITQDFDQLAEKRYNAGQSKDPISPVDPMRDRFAKLVAQVAYEFLVLHELSHIMYGHLKVTPSSQTELQNKLLQQAMEFHADQRAVAISLGSMLSFPSEIPDSFAPIYSTLEQRLFLWCFAIFGIFRLRGLAIDPSKLGAKKHPPSTLRFEMAMATAHMMLRDKHPKLGGRFKDVCHNAQDELDAAMANIGGEHLARDDVIHLFDARTDSHLRKVYKFANRTLIPALEKYSYLPLRAIRH